MTNEQMSELLRRWIEALDEEPINFNQTQAIARDLAEVLREQPQIRQLTHAIQDTRNDTIDCDTCQDRLPEFVQYRLENRHHSDNVEVDESMTFDEIRTHLAQCLHCATIYADVVNSVQMSQASAVPVANSYPEFDLAFLAETSSHVAKQKDHVVDTAELATTRIRQALESGREWIGDVTRGITFIFGPRLQTQTASGWAVKSSEADSLLAQVVLSDEEVEGWEIEGSVFADSEDESLCQVEVSLYNLEDPDRDLSGIHITLGYESTEIHGKTDHSGTAEFKNIPRVQLSLLGVYVNLLGK